MYAYVASIPKTEKFETENDVCPVCGKILDNGWKVVRWPEGVGQHKRCLASCDEFLKAWAQAKRLVRQ